MRRPFHGLEFLEEKSMAFMCQKFENFLGDLVGERGFADNVVWFLVDMLRNFVFLKHCMHFQSIFNRCDVWSDRLN